MLSFLASMMMCTVCLVFAQKAAADITKDDLTNILVNSDEDDAREAKSNLKSAQIKNLQTFASE